MIIFKAEFTKPHSQLQKNYQQLLSALINIIIRNNIFENYINGKSIKITENNVFTSIKTL